MRINKVAADLRTAIRKSGLKDGMTISFHHHLRSGDFVLNMVLDELAAMGFHDLTVNASSIHDGQAGLIEHMKNKVVTGLEADYIGPVVGRALSEGILQKPVLFRTHGGRAGSLLTGRSHVDVAFLAAPTCDTMGNCTGKTGRSACGSLGYAFADAQCADHVIALTDNLVEYPLHDFSISEDYIDQVVCVDAIGDPNGIASGTTKMTKDPVALRIAQLAANAIDASGLLKNGLSFQTGAGGASLAVAAYLKEIMLRKQIRGSYALGGITGYIVDMLNMGLFSSILDVQCFDLKAVESIRSNPKHREITGSHYASVFAKSTAADSLDCVVLGATQIDQDFNVNVHTDSRGYIMGGSGGHTDVAQCAKLTLVVAPVSRARMPVVVDKVLTVSTPGSSIDAYVSQYGIAVNPLRPDLKAALTAAGLPVKDMEEQKALCARINGVPARAKVAQGRIVANVLNRDDTLLDVIRQV